MSTLILTGSGLTLADVYDVAYGGRQVEISADAYGRLARGREIMQRLSRQGKPIYGFNRGGKWPLSVVLMTIAGALIAFALWAI